jgi:hypothetical protein
MVSQKVIEDIYKKFQKPAKDVAQLNIPYFIDKLSAHHNLAISSDGKEIEIHGLDESNPFKRFLAHRLTNIFEFDNTVAFAFADHIIFFSKHSEEMRVHFKREKRSLLSRIFAREK